MRQPSTKGQNQPFLLLIWIVLDLRCSPNGLVAAKDAKNNETDDINTNNETDVGDTCKLWLAPSTIPGAGNGMFAGTYTQTGQTVTPGDLIVPIMDYAFHNGWDDDQQAYVASNQEEQDEEQEKEDGEVQRKSASDKHGREIKKKALSSQSSFFLWDEYTWEASSFNDMEQEAYETYGASFGMGAAVNCNYALINMESSDNHADDVTTSLNPGSGAYTTYHDRRGLANVDIPAGMELFVDYGETYFDYNKKHLGVPTYKDLERARRFLHRVAKLMDRVSSSRVGPLKKNTNTSGLFFATVHEHTENNNDKKEAHGEPAWEVDLYHLIAHSIRLIWDNVVFLKTLPTHWNQVPEILEWGIEYAHYDRSIRSLEELRTVGSCMDHLRPGPSRIPYAGRGAFVHRSLQKGDTIAPMPLIHLAHRSVLNMYRHPQSSTDVRGAQLPIQHQQLLLNYCFGHPATDLLLCPYGVLTSLVNHASYGDPNLEPNAKLVWSDKHTTRPEWQTLPIDSWARGGPHQFAGLAWELVATRDLQIGEEVLIDYGRSWQAAWDQHVDAWWNTTHEKREPHTPDYMLNDNEDGIVRTVGEGGAMEDPSRQRLECRELFRPMWGLEEYDGTSYPCRATHRYWDNETQQYLYNVEILDRRQNAVRKKAAATDQCTEEVEEVLFGVPRQIFRFVDEPYQHPQAQPWSFRHEMQIPDHLLPEVWKRTKRAKTLSDTKTHLSPEQTAFATESSKPNQAPSPEVLPLLCEDTTCMSHLEGDNEQMR